VCDVNTRLENLIVSGLVAAAISVSISAGATPAPKPSHGIGSAALSELPSTGEPSLSDQIAALQKRVDRLQQREAIDRKNIFNVANAAAQAQTTADCIIGGDPFLVFSQAGDTGQTDLYAVGDENDPDVQWLATIDPDCLA
jgi:hypothetical protein